MSAMTESYWRRTDAAMRVWERFLIIRAGFGVFTHSGPEVVTRLTTRMRPHLSLLE